MSVACPHARGKGPIKMRLVEITAICAEEKSQLEFLRVWLRDGKLRGRLIGGRKSGYRIPASEIERLLAPDEGPVEQIP